MVESKYIEDLNNAAFFFLTIFFPANTRQRILNYPWMALCLAFTHLNSVIFFFCFIILKTLLNWIFKILFDAQILLHV